MDSWIGGHKVSVILEKKKAAYTEWEALIKVENMRCLEL